MARELAAWRMAHQNPNPAEKKFLQVRYHGMAAFFFSRFSFIVNPLATNFSISIRWRDVFVCVRFWFTVDAQRSPRRMFCRFDYIFFFFLRIQVAANVHCGTGNTVASADAAATLNCICAVLLL